MTAPIYGNLVPTSHYVGDCVRPPLTSWGPPSGFMLIREVVTSHMLNRASLIIAIHAVSSRTAICFSPFTMDSNFLLQQSCEGAALPLFFRRPWGAVQSRPDAIIKCKARSVDLAIRLADVPFPISFLTYFKRGRTPEAQGGRDLQAGKRREISMVFSWKEVQMRSALVCATRHSVRDGHLDVNCLDEIARSIVSIMTPPLRVLFPVNGS